MKRTMKQQLAAARLELAGLENAMRRIIGWSLAEIAGIEARPPRDAWNVASYAADRAHPLSLLTSTIDAVADDLFDTGDLDDALRLRRLHHDLWLACRWVQEARDRAWTRFSEAGGA